MDSSQIVVTTTPSETPLIRPEHLHPGLHITAMGSDAEHKQEIDAPVLGRVDLFACDVRAQSARLGEMRAALAAGALESPEAAVELGDIISGRHPGRTHDDRITLCDLTGAGVQDTAIARVALERAVALELGTNLSGASS